MNLVIDFGNTRIKAGIFSDNTLIRFSVYNSADEFISDIDSYKNIKRCLICSVTDAHVPVFEVCTHHFPAQVFQKDTPVPVKNLYQSAITLGSDRLAAAVACHALYPRQHVLSIDAGTCIKYNFVNAYGEYLGGAISPGIPMRLKAMNSQTHALPLVQAADIEPKLTGTTTRDSLISGAVIGAACEADGMIERYGALYSNLVVVLTGGDAQLLAGQLKNRFFANQNLLLYGLNTILNFNLVS
jgi:type III pantothenate kinase